MADKTFRTDDELVALMASRNVDISTAEHEAFARNALQNEGYYNLINGYGKLFIDSDVPEDHYMDGTTVEEIYALYDFDRQLRNIMLKHVLLVETHVKNLIAYHFSRLYGHDNYMLYRNFDTSRRDAEKRITEVIADFQHQIASKSGDPSIAHYLKHYGYVPLWVANNVMTLGQVSKFYSVMKQPDRQLVSRTFQLMDNQLESILYYLSTIRNFCAHGNRLYCFRSRRPIADLPAHSTISTDAADGVEYRYGKRDLFAGVIGLKYTLNSPDFSNLVAELKCAISSLQPNLSVLKIDDVMGKMGFPGDWDARLSLS